MSDDAHSACRCRVGFVFRHDQQVQVALRSLKVDWRFDLVIPRGHWVLP